jgi:surfeit locus 1 family protein
VDRRWHRPRAFALLLTAFGLAVFVTLGLWQVDRAAEKERLFAAFAGAETEAPLTLEAARQSPDTSHFPRVVAHGRYDQEHSYVLVDQTHDGRVGSVAYAIFEPDDGSPPLLVNRGFVASKERGAESPVPLPPGGDQELSGLYAPPPGSGLHLGGNPLPRQKGWPKESIYLDIGEIAADAGRNLDQRVLLLDPKEGSGFVREWRPNVFPPERHRAYAFTWFTLAAVVVVVFVIMHWRKDPST